MKKVLYIITKPSIEDISSVIFDHDSSELHVRVLFVQEGVGHSLSGSYTCEALREDILARKFESSCPLVEYTGMVTAIFESDLVITI